MVVTSSELLRQQLYGRYFPTDNILCESGVGATFTDDLTDPIRVIVLSWYDVPMHGYRKCVPAGSSIFLIVDEIDQIAADKICSSVATTFNGIFIK